VTEIAIRRADASDAHVLALHRVGMFRDMGSIGASLEPALIEESRRYFEVAVPAGEYTAFLLHVAGDPKRVVGGGVVLTRRLLPRPDADGKRLLLGPEGLVMNVYIEPGYRRRGLARRLMTEIIAWAGEAGIVRLVLHASDDGRPLYESMDFVNTNEMRYTRPLGPRTQNPRP